MAGRHNATVNEASPVSVSNGRHVTNLTFLPSPRYMISYDGSRRVQASAKANKSCLKCL